ncbi:L10-interacting MYB domain-containing protein [Pyrus x bretschneideri]|uniref:L10-interacting MYB domain-containing protein n=1 Tax=Pyrus x bretschneideri TaxID=225117 RepID=UPI0005115898|nr:L10-interacting MYB domain-containing protein [Pyrus x bretschneideri]XP_048446567.1 L10-interacting MYB domain-containing protein [Pyrus x bretschneideri]
MYSSTRSKATWTPGHRKVFFDLCLEEMDKGNKPGTHFTKEGWRNLIQGFYEQTGLRYTKKQMKNHWDFTKKQWKVWVKLIAESSMKWDPTTNQFGASAEEWANYIQVNPEAAQFQHKEIPCPDLLEILFVGTTDSGDMEPCDSQRRQSNSSDNSYLHSEEQDLVTVELGEEHISNAVPLRSYVAQSEHRLTTASEQSISSSSHSKAKAIWSPASHGVFIDLCLEETLKGNKPGTHFTRDAWRTIVESFNQKTGLMYDRLQLKNHWDVTKEQWRNWCKLIGTTSMGWNPNTRRFGANDEDWASYLETDPEAASFRFKEPQCADKLEIIFDGTIDTGETEPHAKRRKYNDNLSTSVLHIEEDGGIANQEENNVEQLDAVTFALAQGKPTYSIGECINCLDAMEEVEQGSDLYLFALDVFLKKEYREIFLQLKRPSVRIAWLQRLQSVGPPLF